MVQENQERLKLNGTHQHLVYADEVDIAAENTDTIKKNTEALLDANKEAVLDVNPEKTKYMLKPCNQKVGKQYSIKTANRSFEDAVKFRYMGTALTEQNCKHKEIKSRLNLGNAC
jgi:hypothetical protein